MSCSGTSATTRLYTTPIADGDLVYIATYSGEVHAVAIGSGEQVWVYPPKGEGFIGAVVGDPVIANGIVYTSSSDGKVYALNATNGKIKWETDRPLADKLWTSPAIQGDTLYVSTLDGHIYALSVETGQLLDWSFEADAGFASSPVIDENRIYVGSFDRYLYGVGIGSNSSIWRFPSEEAAGNWFWASPIVSEGIVYAGCLDGRLYAVEAKTGNKVREFDAESPIVSSPVLTDGLLVVAAESGNVYVFDLEGALEHEAVASKAISIGANVRSSFCADDELVYILDEHNELYAVDIDKGEVSWKVSLTIEE